MNRINRVTVYFCRGTHDFWIRAICDDYDDCVKTAKVFDFDLKENKVKIYAYGRPVWLKVDHYDTYSLERYMKQFFKLEV